MDVGHFLALRRMNDRLVVGRADSDTTLFSDLMYFGEMLTKTIVCGMIALIGDDKEKSRYQQAFKAVRINGIGDWSSILDEILVGPSSQNLVNEGRVEQRELTQKCGKGTWQHESIVKLNQCLALDLSPFSHPSIDRVRSSFEPVWLGGATGWGAKPPNERSAPSRCIVGSLSVA